MEPTELIDNPMQPENKRRWEIALNCLILFFLVRLLWIFVGYMIDKMEPSHVNPLLPSYARDYVADSTHVFNALRGIVECGALILAFIFKLLRLPIIAVTILIAGFIASYFSFYLLIP